MKKLIGYPLIFISSLLLLISMVDAVTVFWNIYGAWIGVIAATSAPVALLLRSILVIWVNGDWSELIYNGVLIGLVALGNRMLTPKYIIKKPKELHINEENLPQISKYDTIKAFVSIPLVYYGVLFGASLTLIIGVLLIFLIYYLEASATGYVHTGVLITIGLGALVGIYASLYSIVKSFTRKPDKVFGLLIKDKDSEIYKITREVANRVNGKIPENILVVYGSDFHVQEANSELTTGESIKGNTLTIGYPFLRYLSTTEIKAVIGHEMAHFTGRDTVFSTKISPAYRSLKLWVGNLQSIAGDEKASAAAKLPNLLPLLVANAVFKWFVKNLSRVDRVREARADMIGSICYGTNAFSNALKKVKQVGYMFTEASNRDQYEYASNGKVIPNYYEYFDENYMRDPKIKDYLDDIVKKDKITSEFDTHYSFDERIAYLPDDNVVDYSTSERILNKETLKVYEEKLSKIYTEYISDLFELIRNLQNQTVTQQNQSHVDEDNTSQVKHHGTLLTFPKCPNCGREFSSSVEVCRYCKVPLLKYSGDTMEENKKISEEKTLYCKKCGKSILQGSEFCKYCGTKIK